jgi:ferredoxin
MLYIDPNECIDCGACQPECPVEAIFIDRDVPAMWTHFVQLNADRVAVLKAAGPITEKMPAKEGPGCRRAMRN